MSRVPLPARSIVLVVVVWALFHHVAFFAADGRCFASHDGAFLRPVLFQMHKNRTEGVPVWRIALHRLHRSAYPVNTLSMLAVLSVAPVDLRVFHLAKFAWFALLIAGAFALGRQTAGPAAGVVAAIACAGMPVYIDFSRRFFPHLPAAAIAIWVHVLVLQIRTVGWSGGRLVAMIALTNLALFAHPIALVLVAPAYAALLFFERRPHGVQTAELCVAVTLAIQALRWPLFTRYYELKKQFVAGSGAFDSPADLLTTWFERTPLDHLGWLLLAPVAVGTALAIAGAIRRRSLRWSTAYLAASIAFYGACSVWIVYSGGMAHDAMLAYALIVPMLAGELAGAHAGRRQAIAAVAACALAAWVVVVSVRNQTDGCRIPTADRLRTLDRESLGFVQPETDLMRRLARVIDDRSPGPPGPAREFAAVPGDGGWAVGKRPHPFKTLDILLALDHPLRPIDGDGAGPVSNVLYFDVPRGEATSRTVRGGMDAAEALFPGARIVDWSYAPDPACHPVCVRGSGGTLALVIAPTGADEERNRGDE